MLAAQHRMRSSQDFLLVRRYGDKVVLPGLIMHIYTGTYSDGLCRVGLTVGKDCGNSVQRHRISRRIREAMRPVVEHLPAGSGVVVKALPAIANTRVDSDMVASALLAKVGL
jgi:ribonuclease P protein component